MPALTTERWTHVADYSITGDTKLDTSGFTKGVSSMTVAAGNLISDLTKTAATKLAGQRRHEF